MRTITIDSCLEIEAQQLMNHQTLKKIKSYQPKVKMDIPPQWEGIRGDISKDPIALSLMVRLEAGSLDSSLPLPPGHK